MSDGKNTATIKFGQGFDAPWYVSNGEKPDEIGRDLITIFNLQPANDASVADIIALAAKTAQGIWQGHSTLGGTPQAPAQQPAAPQGGWAAQSRGNEAPAATQGSQTGPGGNCPHGARVWKEGVGKTKPDGTPGKPYKGWFCPQRGTTCPPVWA